MTLDVDLAPVRRRGRLAVPLLQTGGLQVERPRLHRAAHGAAIFDVAAPLAPAAADPAGRSEPAAAGGDSPYPRSTPRSSAAAGRTQGRTSPGPTLARPILPATPAPASFPAAQGPGYYMTLPALVAGTPLSSSWTCPALGCSTPPSWASSGTVLCRLRNRRGPAGGG